MKKKKSDKTNILFVCRHNRFRSKIAEAYFKKINKNPSIIVKSAGLIKGSYPLDKEEVKVAKKLKIKLSGKPNPLSMNDLKETDILVIVADNVPKKIFDYNHHKRKIIIWRIKDVNGNESKTLIEKRIKEIMNKVNIFNKKLETGKLGKIK